jgi:hypothetical protein
MTYSKDVKIKPYEGKNYKNVVPKILILGMSEWGREFEGNRERSIEYIDGIKNGKVPPHPYFTKVFNVFHLEYHDDKKSFWDDVCFYNYIQEVMDGAQQKTPIEYWESAEKPFAEVITKLRPDIIIVTGFETYKHLPDYGKVGKIVKIADEEMETWEYNINGKKIYVCKTHHPAFHGYKPESWRKLFLKFIKSYKNE